MTFIAQRLNALREESEKKEFLGEKYGEKRAFSNIQKQILSGGAWEWVEETSVRIWCCHVPEEVARLRRGDSPVRRDSAPVRSLSPKKPQPSVLAGLTENGTVRDRVQALKITH